MKTGIAEALMLTLIMGGVILFCRALPFIVFRNPRSKPPKAGGWTAFFTFVERVAPPAAMTVLAANAIAGPVKGDLREAIPTLSAAAGTALVHLWKRNPFLSIAGGTGLYMILERFFRP